MQPKKLVKPAYEDHVNSVDLFDANRTNELGEMYCVQAAILQSQVDRYWDLYLDYLWHLEGAEPQGSKRETNNSQI